LNSHKHFVAGAQNAIFTFDGIIAIGTRYGTTRCPLLLIETAHCKTNDLNSICVRNQLSLLYFFSHPHDLTTLSRSLDSVSTSDDNGCYQQQRIALA